MPKSLYAAVLTVMVAGCMNSSAEMLSTTPYPAVAPDSVVVFVSIDDVSAQGLEYERVAMLFLTGDADFTTEHGMLRRARQDAGKLGANGIIIGDTREPGFFQSNRKGRVLAIRTKPKTP